MAISIQADPVGYGDMEATEREGGIAYFRRYLLVTGITKKTHDAITEVLTEVDKTYPKRSSYSSGPLSNLILVSRSVRIMAAEGKPSSAIVTLEYQARGESDAGGVVTIDGSLKQITTANHSYTVNGAPVPLAVTYTYPADYQYNTALAGVTVTQGAEVNVLWPNMTIRAVKYLTSSHVVRSIANYLGCLNGEVFLGANPGTVLCTNIQAQANDFANNVWKVTFEFTYDGAGYQPDVVFRDPNTGVPPNDLVANVGYYTAYWYPYANFNDLFE